MYNLTTDCINIFNVPLFVSSGHSDIVASVVFSPDSKTIISGSYDNSIKIWSVPDMSDDVNHAIYGVYYICDVKTLLGLHKVVVAIYP